MEYTSPWLRQLGAIGDRPGDSDDERLQHRSLVTMAVLMSLAALVWGASTLALGLGFQALIPLGYAGLSVANLAAFRAFKDFRTTRVIQVGASLLLPFLFQWTIGGFAPSGGVMLWSLVALIGSLTFAEAAWTLRWMWAFSILVVVSGVVDPFAAVALPGGVLPTWLERVAFVFNALAISWAAFGLTIFLLTRRQQALDDLTFAHSQIRAMNEQLEEQVEVRTEELRAALAENTALIQHVAEGLVGVDADGMLRSANPRVRELLAVDLPLVGRRCEDVLPEPIVTLGRRCHEDGCIDSVVFDLDDGRTLSATASPVRSANLKLGCVVSIRDVTMERQIDRMKTDFTATVSHELRTPLTSVLGFAKVIRNQLDKRVFPLVPEDEQRARKTIDRTRSNLDVIVAEGERLTALINDMLDISKMESGRMQWRRAPMRGAELIERAVGATASLFQGSDVVATTQVAPELPELLGDRDRVVQVLINLLSNSVKFTESGQVTVSAVPRDAGVLFAVRDTGSGIPSHRLAEVFERFKQIDDPEEVPRGTGLGLPICRQIVEAHGGWIDVESQVGHGSTFSFWLPCIPPEDTPVSADAHAVA